MNTPKQNNKTVIKLTRGQVRAAVAVAAVLVFGAAMFITSLPSHEDWLKEHYCYMPNEDKIKAGIDKSPIYVCPTRIK